MFNALKYIKVLEAAGFGRDQAEAQVQLVMAAIEEEVATKSDIAELRADFAEFKADIIFKLGALMIACSTIGFAALGLLITLK